MTGVICPAKLFTPKTVLIEICYYQLTYESLHTNYILLRNHVYSWIWMYEQNSQCYQPDIIQYHF